MQTSVEGKPAFGYIRVLLEPGEEVVAEADAMVSMGPDVELNTKTNGGCLGAVAKGIFGGESFWVNVFKNTGSTQQEVILTQATPGDIAELELSGGSICMQPGAYIASTPDVTLGVAWAGITSGLFAREGFFKLTAKGRGKVWYGAFGCLVTKEVDPEYIVDTSHLVAYPPGMKLKTQMAGGLISSLTSGEGLVTRVEGRGTITIQTRSVDGLAGWINPKLPY